MNDTSNQETNRTSTQNPSFAARLVNAPRDLLICLMFFTRLPVRLNLKTQVSLHVSVHMYPYAGAIVGFLGALVILSATILGLSPVPTAILAITAMVFTTGALHEDGLADMADGFGGGHDRQRKLDIMKDSRIGTYGVLALIFSQGLRIAVLAELIGLSPVGGVISVILAAVFSRTISMLFWASLTPARGDGLSKSSGQPDRIALAIAMGLSLSLMALLQSFGFGFVPLIVAMMGALVSLFLLVWLCKRQIQGQTGDTIGATQQISELAFMTMLLMSL
ncbi:MAG: adenosylcobinamide-GDP ribazoletransferase [Hyphomicrobiales bacterium]